jgi:hypothetical protein
VILKFSLARDALFALFAAGEETPWIGNSLFGRGRKRREGENAAGVGSDHPSNPHRPGQ